MAATPPLVEDADIHLQVQPNGVDLRVERVQRLTSPGLLGAADNVREPAAREDVLADKDGWWDLHRGAYVITYREKVNLPTDLMALSRPRSSLLRSGAAIRSRREPGRVPRQRRRAGRDHRHREGLGSFSIVWGASRRARHRWRSFQSPLGESPRADRSRG